MWGVPFATIGGRTRMITIQSCIVCLKEERPKKGGTAAKDKLEVFSSAELIGGMEGDFLVFAGSEIVTANTSSLFCGNRACFPSLLIFQIRGN